MSDNDTLMSDNDTLMSDNDTLMSDHATQVFCLVDVVVQHARLDRLALPPEELVREEGVHRRDDRLEVVAMRQPQARAERRVAQRVPPARDLGVARLPRLGRPADARQR